jgi:hypothetical protein
MYPEYEGNVSRAAITLMTEELQALSTAIIGHSVPQDVQGHIDLLEGLWVDEESADYFVPGWRFLVAAVLGLFRCFVE